MKFLTSSPAARFQTCLLTLLMACVFFLSGCATTVGSQTSTEREVEKVNGSGVTGVQTAYEGSTGPRLLMERYKSGEIEGLEDKER